MAEEGLLDRGKSYEEQNRYTIPKIINGKKGQFIPLKERTNIFDGDVEVIGRPLPNNNSKPDTSQQSDTFNRRGMF